LKSIPDFLHVNLPPGGNDLTMPSFRSPLRIFALIVALATLVHLLSLGVAYCEKDKTQHEQKSNEPKIDTDPNASPPTPRNISRYLSLGGYLELRNKMERNFDLNDNEDDTLVITQPTLSLAARIRPKKQVEAYINVRLSREFALKEEGNYKKNRNTKLKVSQAYLSVKDIGEKLTLTLGRQRLHDDREWLYDDKFDAVRCLYELPKTTIDLTLSWNGFSDDDLLEERNNERSDNYILRIDHQLSKEVTLSPYALYRYDRSQEWERPFFVGVHSSGEIADNLDFWQELAWVKGKEKDINQKTGDRRTIEFEGIGFDLGARYRFDEPCDPSVALGFAFGNGDRGSDPDDHAGFRQTGLQDNADKLNGIPTVHYYGELFDPELSNLMVLTLGAGIRPSKHSSIELIYHYYRQDRASAELRDSDIDADPGGVHEALGSEIDFVAGLRYATFYIEASFGAFMPGNAFSEETDSTAFLGEVNLRYKF
jgi:hypothetical protein